MFRQGEAPSVHACWARLAATLTCVARPAALRRKTACRRISSSGWFFMSTARVLPLPVRRGNLSTGPEQRHPALCKWQVRLTVLGVEVWVMPRPQRFFYLKLWILLFEGRQEGV